MSNDPFFDVFNNHQVQLLNLDDESRLDALPAQPRNPDGTFTYFEDNEEFFDLFNASVKGVQSSFKHLSEEDIAAPPHNWLDAALARQIALHILVTHFSVPKNRIVNELNRSKKCVRTAIDVVEQRLLSQPFSETYEAIVQEAELQLERNNEE